MVFIPDDILGESIRESVKGNHLQNDVLLRYAMHSQNEGTEPDPERLAQELDEPLEKVKEALSYLSDKGWLEKVKDYFE
jgi:DNA-directed RNA polymerase sigma subunit (sigma70/sigma32)